ncbi:hypothetical protein MB02_12280 [Croceicoccus estronivorus]|uniref:NAD(P)H-dependent oxidoreductase n=1 Tax=Croceicoccus estronivorus TaxID=1172626 RepID=UPI00082B23E0|nr:NAD(P)H-dependent oxidoreductase [Croceicoccus estronivorus]OCC23388.1 hypothetical protein MB02_12280 [Croceicoccus estronivorus]
MRYLIVFAHPERRSLNGFLRDRAVAALEQAGHTVLQSDLYAMGFKAVADRNDFAEEDAPADSRLIYYESSAKAWSGGRLSPDIAAEHEKLAQADVVVLQFPLWWFGAPAILKGWIDRVFCNGYAIGVPRPGQRGAARYGEGPLSGKRAMVAVSTGGPAAHFSAHGIHGPIEDLLFPVMHGLLFYAGAMVVDPFVTFATTGMSADDADAIGDAYCDRLLTVGEAPPILYRTEHGGDYERGVLRPDLAQGTGFSLHRQVPE